MQVRAQRYGTTQQNHITDFKKRYAFIGHAAPLLNPYKVGVPAGI